jgi:hypothetical protein
VTEGEEIPTATRTIPPSPVTSGLGPPHTPNRDPGKEQ